jgi:cold shock CspA family protein
MEPLDSAYKKFQAFMESLTDGHWESICSEADTRMKLIDPIFKDVLGWSNLNIHLEEANQEGRIDYRFSVGSLSRLITEAKKQARDLGINASHSARYLKLSGSVFSTEAAQEAIRQLIGYCAYRSAELACATNGRQWFVFRGNRLGDGTDVMEGVACVFGSLDAVRSNFQVFYDLLSYEAVSENRFRAIFRVAEGQPVRSANFRAPLRRPESKAFLQSDQISRDLDRIMLSFFQDLSGEDDQQARRACFVTTKESTDAERNLARISDDLRNQVRSLNTSSASEFTESIKRIKEMQKQELILLVGTKGAGKSTFVERFFADVLPSDIAQDTVVIRVNLAACGCDAKAIIEWLDIHLLELAERAAFAERENNLPTYDDLQGMFFREYERWRTGHGKHLYERSQEEFKIEFGKHVEHIRQTRPHDYIVHLLHRIALGFSKVPCLVFDNADHFDVPFQEAVFKYAHSLYSQCICLVVVPITDTTSWQLSKQGAMQSFYSDAYYLPTPATDLVLRKRIDYIEQKIAEEPAEAGSGYFFGRGIRLEIENIKAFASCLQKLFISTGQVAEWIGRLSNQDVRRSLQLTREIVSSPHIRVADLLMAFVGKTTMAVDVDNIKLAILCGRYDIHPSGASSFAQNVFDVVSDVDTSPLIGIRVLVHLKSALDRNPDNDERYIIFRDIEKFFYDIGIEPRATLSCMNTLIKTGLAIDYDPTASGVSPESRFQISPSGVQHLQWGMSDLIYLETMSQTTPLLDQSLFDEFRFLYENPRADQRRQAIIRFLDYLVAEDTHYVLVPKHDVYAQQQSILVQLSERIKAVKRFPVSNAQSRYTRRVGRVRSWDRDKGFGFVRVHGTDRDAFLHISDTMNCEQGFLNQGALIECDLIEESRGPKAINALELPDN